MQTLKQVKGQVTVDFSVILGKYVISNLYVAIIDKMGFDTPTEAEQYAVDHGYKLN